MNKEQLAKSIGFRVRLRPTPRTEQGTIVDDDWILRGHDPVVLERVGGGGHQLTLGSDHVEKFDSDPARDTGGVQHGFLMLHSQIIIDGAQIHIEPTPSPRVQARAALMDRRFEMACRDYPRTGSPKAMIDTFTDLTIEEKAALYDRVVMWKKGRPSRENPYRTGMRGSMQDVRG